MKFILERVFSSTPPSLATHGNDTTTPRRATAHRPPNKTSRRGLVTSRVGQGYYRQQILQRFNYRCAVTGSKMEEILIASHIVPWREATDEERLDVDNGILLSPIYDALFDKHLISFTDDGVMLLASTLGTEDVESLGIDTSLRVAVSDGMTPYLGRHRENLR
ncbi:HNH endonuclease signature motif containing protein [Luminiphilus sp.]|nr:HNH endonuclease signature motif containing protein [Luminiphilus sp.]